MLNIGWDYDTALKARKQEGFEAGKMEGILGMLKKNFDHRTIAEITRLSLDKIEELHKKLLPGRI